MVADVAMKRTEDVEQVVTQLVCCFNYDEFLSERLGVVLETKVKASVRGEVWECAEGFI